MKISWIWSLSWLLLLPHLSICVEVQLVLDIPRPSGIIIDRVSDPVTGNNYRFGRLQHNAVSLRPQWSSINIIPNLFSEGQVKDIIARAEKYALEHGWSKGRHIDYSIRPTKDLPVHLLFPVAQEWNGVQALLRNRLFPHYSSLYGINASLLRIDDLFVTKYHSDSASENQLGPHVDKSPWSFVVSLNSDFTGGGTYFLREMKVYQPPVGAALIFNGKQQHGAYSITTGDRYILAGFCEYGTGSYEEFLEEYEEDFDGYAGGKGFRTGDLIVGIEVCREAGAGDSREMESVYDCGGKIVLKRMEEVGEEMKDEDWKERAQSCELLCPHSSTKIKVKRKVPDADEEL